MFSQAERLLLFGLCLTAAACGSTASTVTGSPCPGAISRDQALAIAQDRAVAEGYAHQWVDVRTGWRGSHWTVFVETEPERVLDNVLVDVSADGRVVGCWSDIYCRYQTEWDRSHCAAEAQERLSGDEATRVAVDYLVQREAPVIEGDHGLEWSNAHWWIYSWGGGIIDGHFWIYVSPDGNETEFIGAFDSHSDTAFLRRPPAANETDSRVD